MLANYSWNRESNEQIYRIRAVGLKKPNLLGISDLFGNAKEYTQTLREGDKDEVATARAYLAKGGALGSLFVDMNCESYFQLPAENAAGDVGFRVVRRKSK